MSPASLAASPSPQGPESVAWVDNRGKGFLSRAIWAWMDGAFYAVLLFVLWYSFFGLIGVAVTLFIIALASLLFEAAIARATAVTTDALLVRTWREVRRFELDELVSVRANYLGLSERHLRVRTHHLRRHLYYALPRNRLEEIVRQVDDAKRARESARLLQGQGDPGRP